MKAPMTVIFLGLFVGSIIAGMADVMPYQFILFAVIGLVITAWVEHDSSLATLAIEAGLLVGGIGGAMSATLSFGVALVVAIVLVITVIKSTGTLGNRTATIGNLVILPLLAIFAAGMFYNFSYVDFCTGGVMGGADVCANPATWLNGYPTNWTGCISTCGISAFSIFGSSIFSNFIASGAASNGDYVGLMLSLFNIAIQSPLPTIATVLSIAIGTVLVLLSLGIGVSGNVLATGLGITINEAGTRLAQSYGIGLIIWGLIFAGFGFWTTAVFQGTFGLALGATLLIGFATAYFYGLYLQGKEISA